MANTTNTTNTTDTPPDQPERGWFWISLDDRHASPRTVGWLVSELKRVPKDWALMEHATMLCFGSDVEHAVQATVTRPLDVGDDDEPLAEVFDVPATTSVTLDVLGGAHLPVFEGLTAYYVLGALLLAQRQGHVCPTDTVRLVNAGTRLDMLRAKRH